METIEQEFERPMDELDPEIAEKDLGTLMFIERLYMKPKWRFQGLEQSALKDLWVHLGTYTESMWAEPIFSEEIKKDLFIEIHYDQDPMRIRAAEKLFRDVGFVEFPMPDIENDSDYMFVNCKFLNPKK